VLYVGRKEDPLAEMLLEYPLDAVCVDMEQACDPIWQQIYHPEGFDYIIAVEVLESHPHPEQALTAWRGMLKADGRMLLGMNNRFGLRYFCGDRDIYTDRNFDGVEGYRRAYSKEEDEFLGRCYSRAEIRRMLADSDWPAVHFYSVLCNLKHPNLIFGEDYLPNEDLANRVFPVYHYPQTVFLEEESLYLGLADNGMFHEMANAYLVECSLDGSYSDIYHVTSSMERGRKRALITIIRKSGIVEKRAAYPEGQRQLKRLVEHGRDLKSHGVPIVDVKLENNVCVMPYMDAEVGQIHLKKLLETDMGQFLREMDHFRDLILQSSELVRPDQGDGNGAVLRKGYLDMVPLNSFYQDGTFLFLIRNFMRKIILPMQSLPG